MARELPLITATSQGKQRLLGWFDYLKLANALINTSIGNTSVSLIFLDKDVDDFRRIIRKSSHIVYTVQYDVEGHVFAEGDIFEAIAAAASVDPKTVAETLGKAGDCRLEAAEAWKEWVKICLFTAIHKVDGIPNFGAESPLNKPRCAPANLTEFQTYVQLLQTKARFTDKQFTRAFKQLSLMVDRSYSDGTYGRIFKGKWYPKILEDRLTPIWAQRSINAQGVAHSLTGHVAQTLDFDAPWAEHFKEPLRKLLRRIGYSSSL